MNIILWAGVALVVIGAALYLGGAWDAYLSSQGSYASDEWSRMPAELRTATLVASERDTAASIDGARVGARPDQVYRTAGSKLILVETKTRYRNVTYLSDVVELSVQRLAIDQSNKDPGTAIADYAYVRIILRGRKPKPTYKKVRLLTADQVTQVYRRYQAVVSGQIAPVAQSRHAACKNCSQRANCSVASAA